MTLILAATDRDGTVAMAADRLIAIGDRTMTATRPKIWRTDAAGTPMLLGVCGLLRVADVLGTFRPPRIPEELAPTPAAYVRSVLVPALEAHVVAALGRLTNGRGLLDGSELVVAMAGFVGVVSADLAVIETADGIAASGTGGLAGRAALRALGNLQTPAFRVAHVVGIVAEVQPGSVGGGVDVLELPTARAPADAAA